MSNKEERKIQTDKRVLEACASQMEGDVITDQTLRDVAQHCNIPFDRVKAAMLRIEGDK